MNRLTKNSLITDLPMPIKLQESCGEDACMEACEQYVDNNCNGCPVQECMSKLAIYEDLEKQGLLIKLPCKVGDVVYLLGGKDYNKFRVGCVDWKSGMEYKGKNYQLYMEDNYYDKAYRNFSDIDKTVFLSREEAEKALKEMEGKQ